MINHRIKIAFFFLMTVSPLVGNLCWAMTLKESRQKLLDDYAFFEAQGLVRRQGSAQALVDSKNRASETSDFTKDALLSQEAASSPETDLIHLWFSQNQQAASSGLIVSHPDDTSYIYHEGIEEEWAKILANTQAYTYDQALAGIALLKHGDLTGAKKILDFFHSQMTGEGGDFSGFWTVYNTDPAYDWKKFEWRKGLGENAWIALFALQYSSAQQDPVEKERALDLATTVAKWIGALPHHNGAVAMGVQDLGATPNFGAIYSVENNLDYYALLKTMMTDAAAPDDKAFFTAEFNSLKNWLETEAFDASAGMFKRGGTYYSGADVFVWDGIQSLDVQSWAISAIGIPALINDFGINMDDFISTIHETFAVQDDGSFGGNIFQAKGFDFSDAVNATALARPGIKWVEGTNQMILAYKILADFYEQDAAKASYYQSLADHFLSRNAENAIETNGALSYVYADLAGVQVFAGTSFWKTTPGQAAPSTAWVYLAMRGINPFVTVEAANPGQSFSASASTSSPGLRDLFVDVDESGQAVVRFGNRVLNGMFNITTMSIHLDDVQDSPQALSESWDLTFETTLSGNDPVYSLASFSSTLFHADGWLYDRAYSFTLGGLLESNYFSQQSDDHSVSALTSYTYGTAGEDPFIESTRSTTLFDGIYGYGTETRYAYETDLNQSPLTRITITQETRNNPLFRSLNSYQLVIHDNGFVEYLDLGRQELLI